MRRRFPTPCPALRGRVFGSSSGRSADERDHLIVQIDRNALKGSVGVRDRRRASARGAEPNAGPRAEALRQREERCFGRDELDIVAE